MSMIRNIFVRRACVPAVLVMLSLAGCSRGVAWMDKQDQEMPLVQRAAARAAEGDVESAIRLYMKALDQVPGAARAHLDLAFLLQDTRKDYIGAIYHYHRYLDLRPDTEKRALVEERVRKAEQMFVADIAGPDRMADKVEALERENEVLHVQVGELRKRVIQRTSAVVTPEAEAVEAQQAAAAVTRPVHIAGRAAAVNTYQVKRGDTLTSIAADIYGDGNRWKEIQMANSDILGNASQVKVGQILVLP